MRMKFNIALRDDETGKGVVVELENGVVVYGETVPEAFAVLARETVVNRQGEIQIGSDEPFWRTAGVTFPTSIASVIELEKEFHDLESGPWTE